MATLKTSNPLKTLLTFISVKNIKGTSFVGVQNYVNKEGEKSNQTFVVGINYAKLLQNDFEKLMALDPLKIESKFDAATRLAAHTELLTSLRKRLASPEIQAELLAAGDSTLKASQAQQDAYNHLAKGLKEKDGFLYIYGLCVKKVVTEPVTYKPVNSSDLTRAKNEIKKVANLQETKYKQFKLGNLETLNIKGLSIK